MDEIGGFGVTADEFVRDIAAITTQAIDVHVNSPGGSAFDGMAIFNALKDHPANVNVVVDGLAASAASFILQAGDNRFAAESASIMIHPAQGVAMGDATEMRKTADMLEKVSNSIALIYATRSGRSQEEFTNLMAEETWFNADEALNAGLIDQVGSPQNPKPKKETQNHLADNQAKAAKAAQAALQAAFNNAN